MPEIPSVVALEPLVLIPGEELVATADLLPLIPQDADGVATETVVDCTALDVTGAGLTVDDAGDVAIANSAISFWVDATSAVHGRKHTITATLKFRPSGAIDSSQDRTRKAFLPVLIREKDIP